MLVIFFLIATNHPQGSHFVMSVISFFTVQYEVGAEDLAVLWASSLFPGVQLLLSMYLGPNGQASFFKIVSIFCSSRPWLITALKSR